MLQIESRAYAAMVAHAYDGLPDEACGLLGGRSERASVALFVPCPNVDQSSRTYSIGPEGWRRAEEAFDRLDLDVVGVMHSHTHTDAYPSPTDVDKADNPLLIGWHYIIVSLRQEAPVLRSFVIEGRNISEEAVVLTGR